MKLLKKDFLKSVLDEATNSIYKKPKQLNYNNYEQTKNNIGSLY